MMGTLHMATLVLVAIVTLALLIWAWDTFLDRHDHSPIRIQRIMIAILALVTFAELQLVYANKTRLWVFWASLIVNCWGGLDALLRFPVAHDLESFFTLKQLVLLLAKTLAYVFGMVSLRDHVATFMAVLFLDIWGLPVLYAMALPMDPIDQVRADESDDVDLAIRVWQLAMSSTERQRYLASCRSWMYRGLTAVSEHSSLARMAVCAASPAHRRMLRRRGREV